MPDRSPPSTIHHPRSTIPPLHPWLLTLLLAVAGCRTVQQVKVDAIAHPAKPSGVSYALEVQAPATRIAPELHAEAVAAIHGLLASRGLHEAPAGARPDMAIRAEFGVGPGHIIYEYKARDMLGIDFWGKLPPHGGAEAVLVHDKFLRLDAREPGPGGEELWSVHVVLEDRGTDLAPALPALVAAGREYLARNSGAEKVVELRGREPSLTRPFAQAP